MATINYGGSKPVNISDSLLNPYIQRIQSGEITADQATEELSQNFLTSGQRGSLEGDTALMSFLGTNSYADLNNAFNFFTSGAAKDYLTPYLTGAQGPTAYEPGSLQQGQTPQVQAGTAQPVTEQTQAERQPNQIVENPTTQADLDYQARLQAMGGQAPIPQAPATSTYTGPSVVDYLSSIGQASDFASRASLAKQYGMTNYTGTASQNTQLLNTLRSQNPVQQAPQQQFSMQQIQQQASMTPQQNLAIEQQKAVSPVYETIQSKGVTASEDELYSFAQSDPVKFVTDIYNQMYTSAGLADIKKQFESINKEFEGLQNELSDKIQDINDDPWLTEGVRQKRIQSLQSKYEGRLNNMTNRMSLTQGLYESGLAETRFITQQAVGQYNQQLAMQQDLYFKSLDMAQRQAEAQAGLEQQEFENNLALKKLSSVGSGSGGSSTNASNLTMQVLDGFQSLGDLTPSKKTEVLSELYAQGFGSDTPPSWFRAYMEEQMQMSFTPQALQQEWIKYRDSIVKSSSSTPTGTGINYSDF